MKKFMLVLTALVLTFALAFALVACEKDDATEPTTDQNATQNNDSDNTQNNDNSTGGGETKDEYIDVAMGKSILVDAIDKTNEQTNFEVQSKTAHYYEGEPTTTYEIVWKQSGQGVSKVLYYKNDIVDYVDAGAISSTTENYAGKSAGDFYWLSREESSAWDASAMS